MVLAESNMINKAHKALLQEEYERSVINYLNALLQNWELDSEYGYWVGDEIGGLYAYGDWLFISMDNIIFCVKNDVTEKEYSEWTEYNSKCTEYNLRGMNLKAWHAGAPRMPKESFEHLDSLKEELNKKVEEFKHQKF